MDLGMDGRTALVLGGGGGLGGAIAQALAGEGARVAVADVAQDAAGARADAIAAAGGVGLAVGLDLADPTGFAPAVDAIVRELGPVDVLVNLTGGPPPGPITGLSGDTWASHFQTMVLGVVQLTDLVVPGMRERGWGRVVTSTSSGVVAPIPDLGLSNALRLALVGWSKTLAREVGADGVTANVVLPGRIATGRIEHLDRVRAERGGRTVEDVQRESAASIPLARYGRPEEYADVVAFLASERAGYVTGTVVRVDGGLIAAI